MERDDKVCVASVFHRSEPWWQVLNLGSNGIPLDVAFLTHVATGGHQPVTVCSSGHDGRAINRQRLKTLAGFDEMGVAPVGVGGKQRKSEDVCIFVAVVCPNKTEPLKMGAQDETRRGCLGAARPEALLRK